MANVTEMYQISIIKNCQLSGLDHLVVKLLSTPRYIELKPSIRLDCSNPHAGDVLFGDVIVDKLRSFQFSPSL